MCSIQKVVGENPITVCDDSNLVSHPISSMMQAHTQLHKNIHVYLKDPSSEGEPERKLQGL